MDQQPILTKPCPYCGEGISINAKKCKWCGEWLTEKTAAVSNYVEKPVPHNLAQPQVNVSQPQVIVNQIERSSNGIGTAGFVLALICMLFSWLPGVNFFLWFLGFLFSIIGLFKSPRGLAFAGFLISIIDLIVIVAVLGAVGSFLGGLFS